MSHDIDQNTMDALAGQASGMALAEDLDASVLIKGTVAITRDAEGLKNATEMRDMAIRAIERLKAILPMVLVVLVLAGIGALRADAADRKATYEPRDKTERSWVTMTKAEMLAINAGLKNIAASKVQIFCGGNYCRDLAEDLDEAFESAGFDSYLEIPMFDLGKGAGISPVNDQSRGVAKVIKEATKGRIDLQVIDQSRPSGEVKLIVAIGRKPVGR